jgi:hypothetical protein
MDYWMVQNSKSTTEIATAALFYQEEMCDLSRNPPLIVIHTKWGYYGKRKDEE